MKMYFIADPQPVPVEVARENFEPGLFSASDKHLIVSLDLYAERKEETFWTATFQTVNLIDTASGDMRIEFPDGMTGILKAFPS